VTAALTTDPTTSASNRTPATPAAASAAATAAAAAAADSNPEARHSIHTLQKLSEPLPVLLILSFRPLLRYKGLFVKMPPDYSVSHLLFTWRVTLELLMHHSTVDSGVYVARKLFQELYATSCLSMLSLVILHLQCLLQLLMCGDLKHSLLLCIALDTYSAATALVVYYTINRRYAQQTIQSF
jgi:hypothetical protein